MAIEARAGLVGTAAARRGQVSIERRRSGSGVMKDRLALVAYGGTDVRAEADQRGRESATTAEGDDRRLSARVVKDVGDRTCALLAILAVLPVLAVIAVAIKASSPGPVLYRQTRVGQGGRAFRFIKFRTMVDGAENLRVDLLHQNECDAVLFKIREDPRITSVGRWLRRLSLDELPQLWHVLTGDMSLVGPRPPLPDEVAVYDERAERRMSVKPGLTGLWQISGRSDLPWEQSVELDVHYVENWSIALDAKILVRTLPAVLTGRGAY